MIRELEFKILCERHSDEIYRYAHALLVHRADAEDATQEVLLRLWRHLPRLNPFNLKAWLLQTTRQNAFRSGFCSRATMAWCSCRVMPRLSLNLITAQRFLGSTGQGSQFMSKAKL